MNDEVLIPMLERYAMTRDTALRDELFEQYLPLARAVARKFIGRGAELEDLEQVAAMALLKALERFEPERGYRFVTYAVPTITGDVRNHLRDKSGLMRMPRDSRQRLYQLSKEQEAFEREYLRAPTAQELAQRMQISAEELLSLLQEPLLEAPSARERRKKASAAETPWAIRVARAAPRTPICMGPTNSRSSATLTREEMMR